MVSASSSDRPNGLSHSTARPASMAMATYSPWRKGGEWMETRSSSERHRAATAAGSRAVTTSVTSHPLASKAPATTRPPNPVPITPTRMGLLPETRACPLRPPTSSTVQRSTDPTRRSHLVQLHGVPGRIVKERLAVRPRVNGIGDVHPLRPKLGHHGVEIADPNGEVLAQVAGDRGLEEMDLLSPEVDPGAGQSEVGTIGAQLTPEDAGVEGHRLGHVRHVDGHVMDGERFHGVQSGPDRAGPQRHRTAPTPPVRHR